MTLTQQEKNVRIAERLGVRPRRMWRFWYNAERDHGSTFIHDEATAKLQWQNQVRRWNTEWLGPCLISEPEEYDDWSHAEDYFTDLNTCAEMKATLPIDKTKDFCAAVAQLNNCAEVGYWWAISSATAAQEAEAFGLTVGLWEAGE